MATSLLLDAALTYAANDKAVFPLAPGGKRPITPNGFKDATTDEVVIQAWWTKWPDANIGMATGEISGITVLDVDAKDGKQGEQSLAALTEMNGDLPVTPMQWTWSGGRHYLFRYVPGIRNSAGRLGEDLDIRGDGGYIVVAPSLVENGEYAWDVYENLDTDLAPMPSWMVALLTASPDNGTSRNEPGWAEPFIDGVSEGKRNDTCFRLVGRYARLGLSEAEVLRFMLDWGGRCVPAFDPKVIREQISRTFKRLGSKRLLKLPLTDTGNAERIVALYGTRFRYVIGKRAEFIDWDGRRWKPGSIEAVRGYAVESARALELVVAKSRDLNEDQRKKLFLHAVKSESEHAVTAAVKMLGARTDVLQEVHIDRQELDTSPDKLNVANGTLDLTTFALTPHDPADLITKITDVFYDPLATAPRWEQFLREVFLERQDIIDYVQRAVGYTMTGSIQEQCFFLAYGAGANGKSTFIEVLTAVFGEYGAKIAQEALLTAERNKGRGATPELMEFVGARFAYIDEMEEERRLDEARIKSLTGGEKETGRGLYKGMTTWKNTAKLWFDLNALPSFKGIDEGIARRPRVIPFDRKFEKAQQDPTLAKTLKTELPGILAWAVEGCRQWRLQGLNEPASISLATGAYTDTQNHLPRFMADTYVRTMNGRVPVGEVNAAYTKWCFQNGETQMSPSALKKFIETVWKSRQTKSGVIRFWVGMSARNQEE